MGLDEASIVASNPTYIHTYIFINPKSRMTIQDAKNSQRQNRKGGKYLN